MSTKPLTGRKVLAILLGAFGITIAANMAMLLAATGTFPGLVVKNSYVASQNWNAKTAAQRALSWQARVAHDGGTLQVTLSGANGEPVRGLEVTTRIGRPASGRDDMVVDLAERGGSYAAPLELAPGLWRIEITAGDPGAGAHFEARTELKVAEAG